MSERPPFRHATDVLRYLFDSERTTTVTRSPAAKMTDGTLGDPGPLAGLDGAAEAGSAIAMLRGSLTVLQLSVLACRYAPPKLRRSSRDDKKPRANLRWREAAINVAREALSTALATSKEPSYAFVVAVLRSEFGKEKIRVTTIGTQEGMSLGSCSNHRRLVLDWAWHIESEAFDQAEQVLRGGGFIP